MAENTNFNSEDFSPVDEEKKAEINNVLLKLFSDSLCFIYFDVNIRNYLHENSDSKSSFKSVLSEIICVVFILRHHLPETGKKI